MIRSQAGHRSSAFDMMVGAASLVLLYLLSLYSYLLFHTLAELYSICIAICIFLIGWNLRHAIHNNYLVFVSIAYLFVGLLDMLHALSYKGMGIFRDYDFYANQIWIATRFMEAVTLCAGFLMARSERKIRANLVFAIYGAATLLITLSIMYWKVFPVCFIEGQGLTGFKVMSEYVICLILGASLLLLRKNADLFSADVYRLMQWSVIFTIISELAFTFYIDNYGLSNLVGHYFKIFSFYAMYRALITTGINEPYKFYLKKLNDANDHLLRQGLERENQVKHFNAVFNNSEVGILVAADGLVHDLNPKFSRMTGFSRQDLIGQRLEAVGPLRPLATVLRARFEDRTVETVDSTETLLSTRDSQDLWVSLSARRYFDTSSHSEMVVMVAEDITSKKRTELLKEDVERIVRHDLASPLGNIISLLNLIEISPDADRTEIASYHQLMRKSAERMLRLVRSSSELYKIEHKTYEMRFKEVDLADLIREIEMELLGKIKDKSLSLVLVKERLLAAGDRFPVCGDHFLLFELFSNLLVNAIDASAQGDEILVAFCEDGSSKSVHIVNAMPVPPDIADRFFEKYVTSKRKGGTGLGTYIARIIAEAHSGQIGMETDPAYGTVVSVRLSIGCLVSEQGWPEADSRAVTV